MASLCNNSDFEEPTPEPKKKPRIWVWVVIAAAVIVCFGVGAFGINAILNVDNSTNYQSQDENEDVIQEPTDESNDTKEANPWETVMDSVYGDKHITDPEKLTMENYASEEDYLDTFRIQDSGVMEDVTNGGVADGGNISQEFIDSAVDFIASVANEPDVEARSEAQNAWLENIEETTDFGQRLFYQWEGNMSMLAVPVEYARDNVVYFTETGSDSPDFAELTKNILIIDLNTNRILHYKGGR